LSAKGRKHLKYWVNELSDLPKMRDEQLVKVLCFDLLSCDEIVGHLDGFELNMPQA
jgi:hypothetical protein